MENFESFILDLKELISINSVEGESSQEFPFGVGPYQALNKFIEIASRMGFKCINHENYICEIEVGSGEPIGIIGHLDVVPAGTNWETNPFVLTEKDGKFYGRGVSDDKGPTLACLYALKAVVDSGVKFNRKIKFYAGTNEETGMGDMHYYQNKIGFPEYGFSPDGNFPVVYAEKGVYRVDFYLPKLKNFSSVLGGTAINAVCAHCEVVPKFTPKDNYKEFNLSFDGKVISSEGVQAHGSSPHLGKNAMVPLFKYLIACGEDLEGVLDCLFKDKFGVFDMQTEQGNVTLSPNLVCQTQDNLIISCDVRIPYPLTIQDVKEKLDAFDLEYTVTESHEPTCTDKDGFFVTTLLDAYNKVTNSNLAPIPMSGSTFARAFKKGCSFGAEFPNSETVAHKSNEFVSKKDFITMYEIFKTAIYNLVK